jgi:hypothetical protein
MEATLLFYNRTTTSWIGLFAKSPGKSGVGAGLEYSRRRYFASCISLRCTAMVPLPLIYHRTAGKKNADVDIMRVAVSNRL